MLGEDDNIKKIEKQLIKLYEYESNSILSSMKKNYEKGHNQTMCGLLGRKILGDILESVENLENLTEKPEES